MAAAVPLRITLPDETSVSALHQAPRGAVALCVLAHGAGAGMQHPFMAGLAEALATVGVASLRYQFPYTEAGKKRPDPAPRCEATVQAALRQAPGKLPRFAAGKSMGGRMSSRALAAAGEGGADLARGVVFYGFPLHPPGALEKATERGEHLARVPVPMLFCGGERDAFADWTLLGQTLATLGKRAQLHHVVGADHGFAVRGRKLPDVLAELAGVTRTFIDAVLA